MLFASISIISGIALIWISAEKLEKYSVIVARDFGFSPFFIGSTVIAFGTSAPEMLTTFFVALENQGVMVIGNVIGSNVANLSLVFGSMLLVLAIKNTYIREEAAIRKNLIILIASSLLVWLIIAINPFSVFSSIILLSSLGCVIFIWYKNGKSQEEQLEMIHEQKGALIKLILSIIFLVFAAWLITFGANLVLNKYNFGQLFIGYTILAIGTSLPEIAASISLATKGRFETVSGTLIGSNIFNGLCVLAIPGLFLESEMSQGWSYADWSNLLIFLFFITSFFALYTFLISVSQRKVNIYLGLFFLSSYFISLYFAY